MDSERRVFSEKEANEIVQRAVRLQEAAFEEASPYTPGITRDELLRIAKEMGLAPEYVERALLESSQPESTRGPLHLTEEFQRVIEGELDPDNFDVVLNALRVMNRHHGVGAAQVGRSLNASSWTGLSQAMVQVSARNGRTRINVKSNPLFAWLFALHPATIISIIALATTGEHGQIGVGLAIATGLAVAGWTAFRALLKEGHRRAGELADRLARIISDENARQVRETSAGRSAQHDEVHLRLGDSGQGPE